MAILNRNRFDRLAGVYDLLAWLVFGDRLLRAEGRALQWVSPGDRVLVFGGGTGKSLPLLLERKPAEVVFVEHSRGMLRQAKKRTQAPHVGFVLADARQWDHEVNFDKVYAPFFLDLFPENELRRLIRKWRACLKPEGLFLVVDFSVQTQQKRFGLRTLTAVMYAFFRITTGISAPTLPDFESVFETEGFVLQGKKGGYIACWRWSCPGLISPDLAS